MLVLSRKTEQKIQIGDNITITILLIKGNTVRVGIEAPKNVRVLRAELPPKEVATRPATSPRITRSAAAPANQASESLVEYSSSRSGVSERTNQAESPLSRMRRRAPGASDAALVRLPQRLGPASLRGLGMRRF
jgi:carbon storage regulator CsrA